MNNFKVKTLCAASAGIGSLGAMSAAEAVYLNSDGLGQVLIYPYYTVNAKAAGAAPFQSLLSVVNSTGSAQGGEGPLHRRSEQCGSSRLQPVPLAV